MIPCFICGKTADTGWIEGFPPAPDSQKMALCKEHDTPDNRVLLREAWQKKLQQEISVQTQNKAAKSGGQPNGLLTLFFMSGGSLAIPCEQFYETGHNSLKIKTPNGDTIFYPLQQVRSYMLSPAKGSPKTTSVEDYTLPAGPKAITSG